MHVGVEGNADMTMPVTRPTLRSGLVLLGVGSLISFSAAVFGYFWTGNGIHGTPGALLVVISSALMLVASGALLFVSMMPRSVRGVLLLLIVLDIFGTGVAAYFLETWWIVGAIALALVGWIVHMLADPPPHPRSAEVYVS